MHYRWTLHSRISKQVKHLWFAKLRIFYEFFFQPKKKFVKFVIFYEWKKFVKFDFSIYWSYISYRRDNARLWSLRLSRLFNVTDFDTNRKPAWEFILMNNTNLHSISHRFPVIAQNWSNCRFWKGWVSTQCIRSQ